MRKRRPAPVMDAILEFIIDYKRDPQNEGNSPTYLEVAQGLGTWPANIHKRINRMEKLGLVQINDKGKINLGGKYIPPE